MQFEFPWALGPDAGRYTIREHLGEAPAHILVLRLLGAQQRRHVLPARRRRARAAQPEPAPQPVMTGSATLVDTAPLRDRAAAEAWLAGADLETLAADALARLNRVLHAHRVATADPAAIAVAYAHALVCRVGYGAGEQVADGRWDSARELAAAPRRGGVLGRARAAALRPHERLAALLAGRDAVLACEELALRARADLDAGRFREAALQLRIALEATLAELEPWREQARLAGRLAELREQREDVVTAANAALRGGLDVEHVEAVERVLGRVEAALRARLAGGV